MYKKSSVWNGTIERFSSSAWESMGDCEIHGSFLKSSFNGAWNSRRLLYRHGEVGDASSEKEKLELLTVAVRSNIKGEISHESIRNRSKRASRP